MASPYRLGLLAASLLAVAASIGAASAQPTPVAPVRPGAPVAATTPAAARSSWRSSNLLVTAAAAASVRH